MLATIHPLTPDRWTGLETLFGPRGAYSNCWCAFWRIRRADFNRLSGAGRKAVLHEATFKGEAPGLLAYVGGQPVGWCSVGPREQFGALENSRTLKRLDDQPVWSIVCFFIAREHRRQGLMADLLGGAVEYSRSRGARIVEGYPLDLDVPRLAGQGLHGCSGYMGIAAAYRKAGFVLAGRASETQLIMRYSIH